MDAINAFLARDALVHPDHPFRKAGDTGAELWMGGLDNCDPSSHLCANDFKQSNTVQRGVSSLLLLCSG